MPGLAAKFKDGGYGFDYRMAMNIPDYWIKDYQGITRRGLEAIFYLLGDKESTF